MKIAFVGTSNVQKHADLKRALGMTNKLIEAGSEVVLVIEDHEANSSAVANLDPRVEVRYYKRRGPFAERLQKRRLLRSMAPDVAIYAGTSWRNLPFKGDAEDWTIVTDHTEIRGSFRDSSFIRRRFEDWVESRFVSRSHGSIGVSDYLCEYLQAKGANDVHYSPFATDAVESEVANESEEGSPQAILYVGTLLREYGAVELVEAMALLQGDLPGARMVLAGDGRDRELVVAAIERLGLSDVISLPGFVSGDELASLMATADAFVCPLENSVRDWARCPGKLYLYASYGAPMVTAPVGEALRFADRAVYYETSSPEALASAIETALGLSRPGVPEDDSYVYWDSWVPPLLDWMHMLTDGPQHLASLRSQSAPVEDSTVTWAGAHAA